MNPLSASPALDSSSSSSSTTPGDRPTDTGDAEGDIPLTLTASTLLTDLPVSATAALSATIDSQFPLEKVVVKFKPVGSAPSLKQDVCKISASRKFEEVVRYLRKKLKVDNVVPGGDPPQQQQQQQQQSVFLYVNSAFAPSLDEVVGNLWMCFKNANDQLVVAYAMTPAFG